MKSVLNHSGKQKAVQKVSCVRSEVLILERNVRGRDPFATLDSKDDEVLPVRYCEIQLKLIKI
jgi:hypothetical protein